MAKDHSLMSQPGLEEAFRGQSLPSRRIKEEEY